MHARFQCYIKQVILNAQCLSEAIKNAGYNIITKGTDNHLILIDLHKQNIHGQEAEISLERSGIICNKNCIPFDRKTPLFASGIRLGTAACTSRGFQEKEFFLVGNFITTILKNLTRNTKPHIEILISKKITLLCEKFPLYKKIKTINRKEKS